MVLLVDEVSDNVTTLQLTADAFSFRHETGHCMSYLVVEIVRASTEPCAVHGLFSEGNHCSWTQALGARVNWRRLGHRSMRRRGSSVDGVTFKVECRVSVSHRADPLHVGRNPDDTVLRSSSPSSPYYPLKASETGS